MINHPLLLDDSILPPLCEIMSCDEGIRDERWRDGHAGYVFGVYDRQTLLSTHETLPTARAAAHKAVKPGTKIMLRDMENPDRVYFRQT